MLHQAGATAARCLVASSLLSGLRMEEMLTLRAGGASSRQLAGATVVEVLRVSGGTRPVIPAPTNIPARWLRSELVFTAT